MWALSLHLTGIGLHTQWGFVDRPCARSLTVVSCLARSRAARDTRAHRAAVTRYDLFFYYVHLLLDWRFFTGPCIVWGSCVDLITSTYHVRVRPAMTDYRRNYCLMEHRRNSYTLNLSTYTI